MAKVDEKFLNAAIDNLSHVTVLSAEQIAKLDKALERIRAKDDKKAKNKRSGKNASQKVKG